MKFLCKNEVANIVKVYAVSSAVLEAAGIILLDLDGLWTRISLLTVGAVSVLIYGIGEAVGLLQEIKDCMQEMNTRIKITETGDEPQTEKRRL